MSRKVKSLFDKLYEASSDVLKQLNKPLVRRSTQRKFASAADSALNQKYNAQNELQKIRENIEGLDINALLKQKATIKAANETIELLNEEYLALFGEEIAITEEEAPEEEEN